MVFLDSQLNEVTPPQKNFDVMRACGAAIAGCVCLGCSRQVVSGLSPTRAVCESGFLLVAPISHMYGGAQL